MISDQSEQPVTPPAPPASSPSPDRTPAYRLIPDWPLIFFLLIMAALVMWSDLLGCLAWLVGCSFGYVLAVYEHATDSAPEVAS